MCDFVLVANLNLVTFFEGIASIFPENVDNKTGNDKYNGQNHI
jgi:hypothetical protein